MAAVLGHLVEDLFLLLPWDHAVEREDPEPRKDKQRNLKNSTDIIYWIDLHIIRIVCVYVYDVKCLDTSLWKI